MNSKAKNKLCVKHRDPLKVRKQKLIDKINACKTEREIKEYEKTLAYYHDFDWDYGFLINLIKFKLKRMAEHFHTHHIVVDEEEYAKQCDKAIAILDAGYKTDIIVESDLHNYVNTRNIYRFFNQEQVDFISREGLKVYYLATIREVKAKALFWKYLHHYIEYWW